MAYYLGAHTIGILVFLFLFWKKLKDDYLPSQIFSCAFLVLVGLLLFGTTAFYFNLVFWFWALIVGALIGFLIGYLRFRMQFYEYLEALIIGLLPWKGLFFLGDAVVRQSVTSLVGFAIIFLFVAFYYLLHKNYKNFVWYKSGRVGFSGVMVVGILFLTRGIIAIFFSNVLSFSGKYEPILSGVVAFVFFLLLYNLSRK